MTPPSETTGVVRQRFSAFAALYHRDYRLYWTGQLVSVTGTWLQQVALSWLVLELTRSAFLLGLVGTVQFLPVLLFSLYGGILADRVPKKSLIIATQTGMMLVAFLLGLLVASGRVRYWEVLSCAALLGLLNAADMPARQSFIISLVDRRDLMNALSLHAALFNSARIAGPALAGLIIGRWGLAACFFLNAASFTVLLAQLFRIRASGAVLTSLNASLGVEIRSVLAYVRRTPGILFPLLLLAELSLLAINFNVLVPAFIRLTLGKNVSDYGFVLAVQGLGAVAGGLILAVASRRGPRRWWLGVGALTLAGAQVVLGCWPGYHQAVWLLFLAGLGMTTFASTANTLVQLAVVDEFRGRVMSLYVIFFVGTTPVGNFLVGTIAHRWGVPAAFAVGGGAALFLGILTALWWRQAERRGPGFARAAS